MPELPEVETIKRDLAKNILHKKISSLEIKKKKIIKNHPKLFVSILKNNSFQAINRQGKLLIFSLNDTNYFLLVHLRMTGQLIYHAREKIIAGGHDYPASNTMPNKYTHVIFTFSDKAQLFFNDLRQFGYLKIVTQAELRKIQQAYGIEPLTKSFSWQKFYQLIKKNKSNIKSVLLDQKKIAGLGNIYVDEVCHAAKIHPNKQSNKLNEQEIKKLFHNITRIIKKAIQKHGTTFRNYVDAKGRKGNYTKLLKVYGRAGLRCTTCKNGIIKKIKINGRGTSFCPSCQKI